MIDSMLQDQNRTVGSVIRWSVATALLVYGAVKAVTAWGLPRLTYPLGSDESGMAGAIYFVIGCGSIVLSFMACGFAAAMIDLTGTERGLDRSLSAKLLVLVGLLSLLCSSVCGLLATIIGFALIGVCAAVAFGRWYLQPFAHAFSVPDGFGSEVIFSIGYSVRFFIAEIILVVLLWALYKLTSLGPLGRAPAVWRW